MRFSSPHVLWTLLPLTCLLPFLWALFEKMAARKLSRFASEQVLDQLLRGSSLGDLRERRRTRFVLGFLALVFAVLALARPQMGNREEVIPSLGLDLVFLLDVSNSMLSEDVVPNRLKKAKHIIRNFVDRLSGDRAGVVAFAGSAYPAVPLTSDYDYLRQTLEILDQNTVANQGSDLAKGLETAVELLVHGGMNDEDAATETAEDSSASRVIVVLSDGEANEGEETGLIPMLKEKGVRVYAIGVGSLKGGPIPLRDGSGTLSGYKKDAQGNIVQTKLESANLESIASKTSGKYYAASSNEGEVEEILSEMNGLDREAGVGRRVIVYDEMFQYPMAFAVFFLLLMLFLSDRPRNKAKALRSFALCLACGALCAPRAGAADSVSEYRDTRRGLEAYENKDYAGAAQEFGKAQAANPESPGHHLNLGDAFLKSGAPEAAIHEFQETMKSVDSSEAGRGAYNLGKSYESQKNHEQALRSYQAGLDRLAQDPKADGEVTMRLKRALEQAQQQKQQQQQQGQGGDKGDQDKKKDQDDKKQDQGKDQDKKDKDKGDDQKPVRMPRQKAQFKAEKIKEEDAKRIMQQLQEQEKKAQQQLMRAKTGKPKESKNEKDW